MEKGNSWEKRVRRMAEYLAPRLPEYSGELLSIDVAEAKTKRIG